MRKLLLLFLFQALFCRIYLSAQIDSSASNDSVLIYTWYNEGRELYSDGSFSSAIDLFQKSLELANSSLATNYSLLRTLNNALGITYRAVGDLNGALDYFLEVERLCLLDEYSGQIVLARIYSNIGNVYGNKMNYGKALEYYNRSVDIFKSLPNWSPRLMAEFYYNIANTYFRLNQNETALDIIEEYIEYTADEEKLLFLNLKATVLKELHRVDEAESAYIDAINHARFIYNETDREIIFEYISITNFFISINDFNEAFKFLERIDDLLLKADLDSGIEKALYHKTAGACYRKIFVTSSDISGFCNKKSEYLFQATSHFEQALKALNYNPEDDSSLVGVDNRSLTQSLEIFKLLADTYIELSELYAEKTDDKSDEYLQKALSFYKTSSSLIRRARREISADEHKIILSELEEDTFRKIIKTSQRAYQFNSDPQLLKLAFNSAEQLKSVALFDRLLDQFARKSSLIPDSLILKEKLINFEITSLSEQRLKITQSNAGSDDISRIDSLHFELVRQRDDLNGFLEKTYPDYFNLKYSSEEVPVEDIQRELNSDEVVLELVLNDQQVDPELFLFVVTPDSFLMICIEADTLFLNSVDYVNYQLSRSDFLRVTNQESIEYCKSAHYLYQKIFDPIKEVVRDRKIILIPDGKLNYLPFEALLTELPDLTQSVDYSRLPYLIHNQSIRYGYSATLLFGFKRRDHNRHKRLLLFAPEYVSDTILLDNEKFILDPLPGIVEEAEQIVKIIRSKLLIGEDASETNFRKYCEEYDILHLAMHAFINDSLPTFSKLAFSKVDENSTDDDGWLNVADIYNLKLNARLTVLSACNTGSGKIKRGEGVMSLARGFIYAGCPSVIMTLWSVEDETGATIMQDFYKNLKRGRKIDEALREAKLSYLAGAGNRMAHPHYWLGYIAIGDTTSLFISTDYFLILLLALSATFITAEYLIRMRLKKK